MKLYVINKKSHPENLSQLHKIDYPAHQRYCTLVNTVRGMNNGAVISQSFKEIVHKEVIQIIEQQREQNIEEKKDQHELPQDEN